MVLSNKLDLKIIFSLSWKRISGLLLVAIAVYLARKFGYDEIEVDSLPASILGTALSILLGFKINSAYSRWWDARRLWGAVTNDSRSFARQLLSFNTGNIKDSFRMINRQIAFAYALKDSLRKTTHTDLSAFLDQDDLSFLERKKNIPVAILQLQGQAIATLLENGHITSHQQVQLDRSLTNFSESQGGCERIKNTQFPNSYTFHLNLFIAIYCYLLPFILISKSDWHAIPASVIIGYVFFSLSTIAQHLEDPFEDYYYDVPMSSICRTIEINLLQMAGIETLPDLVQPENGFIH